MVAFNRVQGWSLGGGVGLRVPGVPHTTLYPSARYGLSDGRLLYKLAAVRNGPGRRLGLAGYRDIVDVDPFSPGRTVSNLGQCALHHARQRRPTLEARGGDASLTPPVGLRTELRLSGRVEAQRSVATQARSGLNDLLGGSGDFDVNPAITEGTLAGFGATLRGGDAWRWSLTADGLTGAGATTGRLFGDVRHFFGADRGVLVRLKGGVSTNDPLPQMAFRAGGQQSVRASDYGTQRGQSFWATMVDVSAVGRYLPPGVLRRRRLGRRTRRIRPAEAADRGRRGTVHLQQPASLGPHPLRPQPAVRAGPSDAALRRDHPGRAVRWPAASPCCSCSARGLSPAPGGGNPPPAS
ncbi:MAG: hypothetical protein MZU84_04955 [Sphingobacterium sp.]|nr:hypothetical protein [Sphingobacterium sp.]